MLLKRDKNDLHDTTEYLHRIHNEVLLQRSAGAKFLGGETHPSSQARKYTRWPGYDVLGEFQTQWIYYHVSDGLLRYERRTDFVFKEEPITKSLLRVPEHPKYFIPTAAFIQTCMLPQTSSAGVEPT